MPTMVDAASETMVRSDMINFLFETEQFLCLNLDHTYIRFWGHLSDSS